MAVSTRDLLEDNTFIKLQQKKVLWTGEHWLAKRQSGFVMTSRLYLPQFYNYGRKARHCQNHRCLGGSALSTWAIDGTNITSKEAQTASLITILPL